MYQKMYTHLFNAITDALDAIEAQNVGQASELLREAQRKAEEMYMETEQGEGKGGKN